MEANRTIRNQMLSKKIIEGLKSRNMEGYYAETKEDALKKALELIPEGSSIGWGGSMSIEEIGLKAAVCSGNYTVYNRDSCTEFEEKRAMELKIAESDYFLVSSNAITEDGVLVNVDGMANRVSSIAYGPRNVLMIIGMNKVVCSVEDAMSRARHEASPINAQRFPIDTPCKKTGVCFDCKSPDCICCQTLITRFSKVPNRIKVILVNEDLGF